MDIQELDVSLKRFMFGLLAKATDGDYPEQDYTTDRRKILANSDLKKLLPPEISEHHTAAGFRAFVQGKGSYRERRAFINEALKPALDYIESLLSSNEKFSLNEDAYELGERLGCGGFGAVYKYHHKLLEMDFAIKIFEPVFASDGDKTEGEKRFFREAKMLFHLSHTNIVRVYDIGRTNGKPFIRLEYVEGRTLNERIKQVGGVSFERTKKPIRGILDGLSYADKNGIIHRDLKPSNVMVQNNGVVKIIDFGISAYLETGDHTRLTKTGEQICGGSYQDPQLTSEPSLRDPCSDIYSLGGIWFFLLTNRDPSPDAQRVLQNLNSDWITPAQIDIVLRCLNSDATQRFQNCDEIIGLLFPEEVITKTELALGNSTRRITNITRRDIFRLTWSRIKIETKHIFEPYRFKLFGEMRQLNFLKRLYRLDAMPSNEARLLNFEEEIIQHTINNDDWDNFWIFRDDRLELCSGNDNTLLRFLCEIFHPEVRDWRNQYEQKVSHMALSQLNDLLKEDGYEIYESDKISGRPIFSYRYCL